MTVRTGYHKVHKVHRFTVHTMTAWYFHGTLAYVIYIYGIYFYGFYFYGDILL